MCKLYFSYACMNSGKTAHLLMTAHSFEENNTPFLCLKPEKDTRDGIGVIKSRIGMQRDCISISDEDDLLTCVKNYITHLTENNLSYPKWILVDECQFLTAKQVEELADVVDECDINVMCFGLRTDFQTHAFEGSLRLFELADDINEIKLSCKCGRKAIINARVDEFGNVLSEGSQIEIGGNERYRPMCRKCYHEAIKK